MNMISVFIKKFVSEIIMKVYLLPVECMPWILSGKNSKS